MENVVTETTCVACQNHIESTMRELCHVHQKLYKQFCDLFDEKLRKHMKDSLNPFTYLKDSVREALLKTEASSPRVWQICVEFAKDINISFRNVYDFKDVNMSSMNVWMNMFLHNVQAEIAWITRDLFQLIDVSPREGAIFCNIFVECNEILNFIAAWDRDRDASMKKTIHLYHQLLQLYTSGDPERTILAKMATSVSEISPNVQDVPYVPTNLEVKPVNKDLEEEKKIECPLCIVDQFKTQPALRCATYPCAISHNNFKNSEELCKQHKKVYLWFVFTFEVEFARQAHSCIFVCEELQQKIKNHPLNSSILTPLIESCFTFPQINGTHLVTFESLYANCLVPMPGLPALLRACVFAPQTGIPRLLSTIVVNPKDEPEAKALFQDVQLHLHEYVVLYKNSKDFESFLKKLDVIRTASYTAACKMQHEIMQRHTQYLNEEYGTQNAALICLMDIFSIVCNKSALN